MLSLGAASTKVQVNVELLYSADFLLTAPPGSAWPGCAPPAPTVLVHQGEKQGRFKCITFCQPSRLPCAYQWVCAPALAPPPWGCLPSADLCAKRLADTRAVSHRKISSHCALKFESHEGQIMRFIFSQANKRFLPAAGRDMLPGRQLF